MTTDELMDKFYNIPNWRDGYYSLHNEPNPAAWLRDLLDGDLNHAESEINKIETESAAIGNSPERVWGAYYQARNDEHAKRGVTRDAIMEAQWEKDMEGRPEKADALQVIRLEVKAMIPKPE